MDAFERQVRATVIQTLRDTGEAPTAASIGNTLGVEEPRVTAALRSLADEHRLVLVPGTDRVMMAHPFSGVASDFLVTIGERTWFANCVWDGLSILALLGDGTLETHSPATGEPITLTARDGVVHGDAVVHFLIPARRFWDDIVFTWANITAFRSEADVHLWLEATGREFGAFVTPQVLYDLGRAWYATRLDLDWQPLTAAEATTMFAAHGLVGEFWSLQ